MAKRTFQSLCIRSPFGRKQPTSFKGVVVELPPGNPIEEEIVPDYDTRHYFPVNPGYIFNKKYEALAKLGWGSCSTVWLVRDIKRSKWRSERYLSLKVGNCDVRDAGAASHELLFENHIAHANPRHDGLNYIRTFVDHFEEIGTNGSHICLAYDLLREPLWLFQNRCRDKRFSLTLLKGYIKLLLNALDYLHSECKVIHTDLKMDNILVGFEEPSVIQDFAEAQISNPMPRKVKDGRTVYLSHNDFGALRSYYILPKLTDFGLAHQQKDTPTLNRHPIQPDHYRAPEVILGAGWTYSVDIWNLGLLMWNLLERRDLFCHPFDAYGKYQPGTHLAEMIALLGPPPKELIEREKDGLRWNWSPAAHNSEGKLCTKASEFYGGPFFDENVTSLQGEQKEKFLSFARKMLQWLPDDRKTAKELIADPWLSDESIKSGLA